MTVDRIAPNVRLPASLQPGLVKLARREYRCLNDQIVSILARSVLDGLDPERDDWPTVVATAARNPERYLCLWDARYSPNTAQPLEPFRTGSDGVALSWRPPPRRRIYNAAPTAQNR